MATEVTKLITVSLGKIHQSRQTKCGLNLRKSLLVASVLHKARDLYVTEIKNRRADTKEESVQDNSIPIEEDITEEEPSSDDISTMVDNDGENDEQSYTAAVSSVALDKENSPPATQNSDSLPETTDNSSQQHNSNSSPSPTTTTTDMTNLDTGVTTTTSSTTTSTSSCLRCTTKRRHGQDINTASIPSNKTSDSQSRNDMIVPKKRQRLASHMDQPVLRSSINTTNSSNTSADMGQSSVNNEITPMQTESTQISSLVQIFSTSFSDFSTSKDTSQCSVPDSDSSNCSPATTELNNTFSLCREAIALTA